MTRVRAWEPDCVVELLRADIPLIRCYCPPEHFEEVVAYVRERLPDGDRRAGCMAVDLRGGER